MPRLTTGKDFLAAGVLTGLLCVATSDRGVAQVREITPDFSSNLAGSVAIEPDFLPVAGAPGPITFDPAHPHVSNAAAQRAPESSRRSASPISPIPM